MEEKWIDKRLTGKSPQNRKSINEMINKRLAISILLLQVMTDVNLIKPELELNVRNGFNIPKYIISSSQSQHIGEEIEMVEEGII